MERALSDQEGDRRKRGVIQIRPWPGSALPPEVRDAVMGALAPHRARAGALLPVLHAVQDALGYVPKDAIALIAYELNLSRAEVHGVVTFYHWFRQHPPGRTTMRLCRAEACQAVGGVALEAHVQKRLGIGYHQTSGNGAVSLEPVYCLGNCALGPSIMIDGQVLGRVTPDRFDAALAERELDR